MAYLALYREWRPQTFGDIVGQEHVTRTLHNAVDAGRIAHAYLFCGPRGTGKTTTAKVLAKALNCLGRSGPEPCNRCAACMAINEGLSVDVIEVDAASNRGIDEIRDLREKIKFLPTAGQFRIYIIDEVHMLTNEAFNALLKTLEEPPRHVVFILATTEPHKVPLTILSRCQRFDFRRIAPDVITDRLKEVAAGAGITVEEEALRLIARAADGGLRDALSILDQGAALGEMKITTQDVHNILGTVRVDILSSMAGYLTTGDSGAALRLVGELTGMGKELRLFAGELAAYLRVLLLEKISPGAAAGEMWNDSSIVAQDAADFRLEKLMRSIDLMVQAEQDMKWSSMPGVVLELALVKACRWEIGDDLTALVGRVSELEYKLEKFMERGFEVAMAGSTVLKKTEKPVVRREIVQSVTAESSPVPEVRTGASSTSVSSMTGKTDELQETPVIDGAQPAAAPVGDGQDTSIERVLAFWDNIIDSLHKEKPLLLTVLTKATPLQVNGHNLLIGLPEGEELLKGLVERPENKKYFDGLLGKILGGEWQTRYQFYRGEIQLPSRRQKPAAELERRFGGGEVILDDDVERTLF
ncbi:MAG: DNA polymerase III subunit gamma/tau [Desulfotomaculaceae bacterium]|nr:DNA polymerase III subunit gamma/tau [Desulfotomaculaceae bacterium]